MRYFPKIKRYLPVVLLVLVFGAGGYFALGIFYGAEVSFTQYPELGDAVMVQYNRAISEHQAKKSFSISPAVLGEFMFLEKHNKLYFVPDEPFDSDTRYTVKIKKADFLASITTAVNTFTFSPVSFRGGPPQDISGAVETNYIDVNLRTMQLTLIENNRAIKSYPIAGKGNPWTGPTREGVFRILNKEPNHYSTLSHVWMPYSIQYSGNFFIHEWPYWPGGQRVNSRYSAGCIRLFPGDAEEVYNWAKKGTRVIVHSTDSRLPVFIQSDVFNGDMVREVSDSRVYITKHAGDLPAAQGTAQVGKKFKRHVWTPRFGEWYAHLRPFWQHVKVVTDGTLDTYLESKWVHVNTPEHKNFIYQLNTDKQTRHRMLCGENHLDSDTKPEKCFDAWDDYGWPREELFEITATELEALKEGPEITLSPAPTVLQ